MTHIESSSRNQADSLGKFCELDLGAFSRHRFRNPPFEQGTEESDEEASSENSEIPEPPQPYLEENNAAGPQHPPQKDRLSATSLGVDELQSKELKKEESEENGTRSGPVAKTMSRSAPAAQSCPRRRKIPCVGFLKAVHFGAIRSGLFSVTKT